jgi:hypothetical protein
MGWLVGYLPRGGEEGIEGAEDEVDGDNEKQDRMRVTGRQFRHGPPPEAIIPDPKGFEKPFGSWLVALLRCLSLGWRGQLYGNEFLFLATEDDALLAGVHHHCVALLELAM